MPDSPIRRIVRFGTFELDLAAGELHKNGLRVPIQEQPFRILEQLLARPGQVVTRDELRRRLWNDDTFVDFERGLNAAIKRLRDTLGDSADAPRFIETLSRRGYRFIAPVDAGTVPPEAVAPMASRSAGPGLTSGGGGRLRAPRAGALALVAILALIGVSAGAWKWGFPSTSSGPEHVAPAGASPDSRTGIVAVQLFENRTGETSLDPLGRLAADRVIHALTRIEEVRVHPQPLDRPADGDGSSRALGGASGLLVSGGFYRDGDRVEVQARIHDAATGRLLFSPDPVSGPSNAMGEALERLEQTIAGAAAIHFDEFFGGLEIISSPPRFDAYREYRAGLEIFESDYARMQAHMDRAVQLDAEFWLPVAIKHFGYANVGDEGRAESALAAIESGLDRRSRAERLWAEFMRADWEGRSAPALRALQDLEAMAPRSMGVNFNIVALSVLMNRPRAGVDAYDRLPVQTRSLRHSVGAYRVLLLTHALHVLGEHLRELEEARAAQSYAPATLRFVAAEVGALAALGRIDDLKRVIDTTLAASPSPMSGTAADVMERAALELRAHGHREASLEVANRALEWHRSRVTGEPPTGGREGLLDALVVAERWTEANDIATALHTAHPTDEDYLGELGVLAARLGHATRAGELSEQLRQLTVTGSGSVPENSTLWRAQIAAVLGDRQRAVDLLREAFSLGLPYGPYLHRTPELQLLGDFEPFVELMRPKG